MSRKQNETSQVKRQWYQTTLMETAPGIKSTNVYQNIEPSGDKLVERKENDGILRCASHNVRGTSMGRGLEVPHEIDAMDEFGIDIMAMQETQKPWSKSNKFLYDALMQTRFKVSRTVYSSAPAPHDCNYQSGGTLLTINGTTTGRIVESDKDKMGRYCWYSLRGQRDEGLIVFSVYRVCQEKHDNPGPHTAYMHQYTALRDKGVSNPNPRRQVLKDLVKIIEEKREQGFRPMVLMDANGDYQHPKKPDKDLAQFLIDTGMVDPFYNKFEVSQRTSMFGTKRIDYIFMDPALVHAIKAIGYAGSHQGADSDHVFSWVDFNEQLLFQGVLNRPPSAKSRPIQICQSDKTKKFLEGLVEQCDTHSLREQVFEMASAYVERGSTSRNMQRYASLYGLFLDLVKATAESVGRRNYGYARSTELGIKGHMVLLYKQMLDCKKRNAPLSPALREHMAAYDIKEEMYDKISVKKLRKEVAARRSELWECQKQSESKRVEWIQELAKDRARAEDDPDWEKKMNQMIRVMDESAINRKLGYIFKGRKGAIDTIRVTDYEWHYSPSLNELYRLADGIFEAYTAAGGGTFHTHHSIKAYPKDAVLVEVEVDEETGRWRVKEVIPKPQAIWHDVLVPSKIESALLKRNKRHLQQADIEGGIGTQPPMSTLHENNGFNTMASQLLEGTFTTELEISEEMATFFKCLKQSDQEKKSPPVMGTISSTEFQGMFKAAKEATSSESTTPNYSLWKIMAKSEYLSSFLCVMLSLPFVYGFANPYWTNMTDFMLTKKPGDKRLFNLRIIGKLAAEFNTCLKFLVAKRLSANYENNNPNIEQFGGRPDNSSVDLAMIKLLVNECARLEKSPISQVQFDCRAHFDRIHSSLSGIYQRKHGADDNLVKSINATIDRLKRKVETSNGVSKEVYKQEPDEPRIGGLVQGNAAVPLLSNMQTDVQVQTLKKMTSGLTIKSPTLSRQIRHHTLGFIDDVDGQQSADPKATNPRQDVITKAQVTSQCWSTINLICQGSIAIQKCTAHVLAWEVLDGHMEMVQATEDRIILKDAEGNISVIEFLSPDEPNVGLGYRLCPSGNQLPHHEATLKALTELCQSARGAHLTPREARQAIHQRLIPKLTYAFRVTSLQKKQLNKYNTQIRKTFLGPMKLNEHFPSAVLYGPMEYGGMEMPEAEALQDQAQLPLIVQQARWDKKVANDLLVTMDWSQLVSGLIEPLWEYTSRKVEYMGSNHILDVRRRLDEMDATLWLEKAWYPRKQRVDDSSIMATFIDHPKITRAMLRKTNACRLYMRVVTIADLADASGRYIPDGYLCGDWRAGSDLHWPVQEKPPKSFFAVFRRCLRLTYCTKTNPHQNVAKRMYLVDPLGKWLTVKRHVHFPCYKSRTSLYYRGENNKITEFKKSKTPGYYEYHRDVESLPLECHPIIHQQIGEKVWTHRPYNIETTPIDEVLPAGHMLHNTLTDPKGETVVLGSDGSVHLRHQVAACAWCISEDATHDAQAVFLLSNISNLTSYRAELEGIYRGLKHVQELGLTPRQLTAWCDNEEAVRGSNVTIAKPKGMLGADADILLAIHYLKSQLPFLHVSRHVYGHQDERKRASKLKKKVESKGVVIDHPLEQELVEFNKAEAEKEIEQLIDGCMDKVPSMFPVVADWREWTQDLDQEILEYVGHVGALSCVSTTARRECLILKEGELCCPVNPYAKIMKQKKKLTNQARINVLCDQLANDTAEEGIRHNNETPWMPPVLQPPYPGSKAILKIGDTFITANHGKHIYKARRVGPMRRYCTNKYKWSVEVFDSINWESIGNVRKNQSQALFTRTSKLMHGWLPTGHARRHITEISACPGCNHHDETIDHMLKCPHPFLQRKREEMIAAFRKKGLSKKIPRTIIKPFCEVMRKYLNNNTNYISSVYIPAVKEAIKQQLNIGMKYFPRGFLARGWLTALEDSGTPNPDRKMNLLQSMVWEVITEPLWAERNKVAHAKEARNAELERTELGKRIKWYIENKEWVLSRHDQFLANTDVTRIDSMSLVTKRAWVRHLDKAREAFELEDQQRAKGQHVITNYFHTLENEEGNEEEGRVD